MNRNKKVVAFGIGIIALGGIGWYIMKKQKEENDTKSRLGNAGDPLMPLMADMLQSGQAQGTSWTPPASSTTTSPYAMKIQISNGRGMGKYKWYGIPKTSDRQKVDAGMEIGTYGMINNTEPCTVSNFWMDSNGRKGAFQCEEKAPGSYDIPDGSRFEY
jgi:hypothetical protein